MILYASTVHKDDSYRHHFTVLGREILVTASRILVKNFRFRYSQPIVRIAGRFHTIERRRTFSHNCGEVGLVDITLYDCGCTESTVYAWGQWRNVMRRSQSRMVQHNDIDLTAEPQGPSKAAELPVPCPIVPTHFRPFRHRQDCDLIKETMNYLSHSGFYWGPLEVDEAHARLATLPLGTFLLRDSMQSNVFFTLSYQAPEGPTSVRVLLKDRAFSLAGSKHTFPCLFALLAYYIASPKKSLSRPYRGDTPQSLQELARRAVMQSCKKESIQQLLLSKKLQEFLWLYPFSI